LIVANALAVGADGQLSLQLPHAGERLLQLGNMGRQGAFCSSTTRCSARTRARNLSGSQALMT
jgi:hypothetical protein